ncbi:MAG TPA: alpha/beta hydrolase-fold protein, partial [Acidimicrobiales bacterium]|nr:alpha/beta hydrolase-fold protein [Acidimicrobiales bacterium]
LATIEIPAPAGEIAPHWLSYPGPPRADVLLPAGYNRRTQYPLVVFLNGLDFDYASYANYGLTAPFDHLGAIVVMPEGGNGWYTDWWNDGTRGDPSWESYELDTVIPAVLARYPVLPERGEHALIGISMGGLGAVYLGGRLPGFFGSVATLSGFVDTGLNGAALQPTMALFSQAALKGDDDPDPVDGPPGGFYAAGHDPALLVGNLAHTRVFETTGTGVPSRAEPRPTQFETLEERSVIYPMNERYHRALVAAHVDVTYQVHTGNHDIPDFLAEIRAMLAWGLFEPVVAEPVSWTDRTVATTGQLWDLDYRFAAPPTRVVTFHQRGTTLTISAAGSAVTITTGAGCAVHSATPATVHLPDRTPVSPRRPEAVARRPCR